MKALIAFFIALCALPLAAADAPPVPGVPGQLMIKGLPRVQGDTVGLNLYISTQEKTGYSKVNAEPITTERYLVKDLVAGQQYWFAVTALVNDGSGKTVESKPSEKWTLYAERVRGDETPTPTPSSGKAKKKGSKGGSKR